jgi:hypothetical protein
MNCAAHEYQSISYPQAIEFSKIHSRADGAKRRARVHIPPGYIHPAL